jgi:hypothetical protein
MNAMTRLVLTVPMPRMASVEVVRHLVIRVTWSAGIRASRTDTVDLSPLIISLKFYRTLRTDHALFRTIHLVEGGTILAWGDNDEIDMAADSVEQMAEESMTPDDFRVFLKSNSLTHTEAAAQLGYSRRQIENYLSGNELIPRVVVMACFGLTARKQVLRAVTSITQRTSQVQTIDALTTTEGTISLTHNEPITSSLSEMRASAAGL